MEDLNAPATKGDLQAVKGDVLAVKGEVLTVKGEMLAVKDEMVAVKDEVAELRSKLEETASMLRFEMQHLGDDLRESFRDMQTANAVGVPALACDRAQRIFANWLIGNRLRERRPRVDLGRYRS